MTSLNVFSTQVTIAGLTTATTLYTDGDVLGTAPMAFNVGVDKGVITGAQLINGTVNMGAVDLFVFDRSVTAAANNAAHSVSDTDRAFCWGIIHLPYPTSDALGQVLEVDSIMVGFDCNASTTLYVIPVTRMTHTVHYGAATDFSVRLVGSGDV